MLPESLVLLSYSFIPIPDPSVAVTVARSALGCIIKGRVRAITICAKKLRSINQIAGQAIIFKPEGVEGRHEFFVLAGHGSEFSGADHILPHHNAADD